MLLQLRLKTVSIAELGHTKDRGLDVSDSVSMTLE